MTRIAAVFLPILFLSYPFCSAQTGRANYDAKWKEIDSLYSKKGLTESALKKVNQVYALAKKEHNEPQAIKALIYRMSLTEKKEEGAIQKNIAGLNEEIGLSSGPPRSILYSLLATTYWNYFQNHRWNLYNRTATVQFKKEDITSWDIEDFHEHISSAFLASISEEKLFQQTSLSSYDPLIVKGNVRNLRPTLFDLLAHEALEYFEDNESDLSRASYTFEIDQEAAFAKAREFANFHFNSPDSTSLQLQAIRLFQRLIKFHLNDANPDALIDLDIERIQFANMYGVMESKDSLYLTALKKITDQFGSNPIAAEAWYLQAKYYAEQAGRYDPIKDTLNQFGYVRALKICEQVINEPDSSEGKSGCQSLAHSIERTELSLQAEKVNSLNKPFRILVSNRNLDKAYFRLIKLNKTLRERLNEDREDEKYWNKLIGTKPLREFEQSMPNPGDHQMHRVEMRIDSLASGEYLLLTSTKPDFPLKENILSAQSILVSNISYIHFGRDYFVLDRESGQPLAGTDVQAWYTYYAGSQDKWVERMGEHFITDKNGYFQLFPPKVNNNNQVYLEVAKSGDHLFMNNANNTVYDPENDNSMYGGQPKSGQIKNRNRTFLFTDRSIYRPGQVVYFKGIVITKENSSRESKILSNFKTRLTLFEVNSQKIDSLELTSNEFGTYHGQFILPEGLLTGMFRIEDMGTESQQYISVEEYKRPKFYVEFEKFKGIHRLNDRILLKGFAKAFAGNTIDGAKVKYRVTRQAVFPYLWIRGISGINRTGSQEISHGETKSFADGSFEIPFKAMADFSIDKRSHAYFEFKIEADITDINGETRSGNTVVRIGYDDIRISIALFDNAEIGVDSLKNLSVRTESLSGEFQSSLVHLDIYALQSPDRLIRQRYWEEPDQHIMNEDEYLKNFPNDEYAHETNKDSWPRTAKIFELTDSTRDDQGFHIPVTQFTPGWYLVEAITKDRNGEELKDLRYIELYQPASSNLSSTNYLWANKNAQTIEPGYSAMVQIGSSANNVFLIQVIDKSHPSFSYININKERKSFSFPTVESDRGGFGIHYAFVKNNRIFSGSQRIDVPWTNKELKISYTSFRDKTLPGSGEKWKLRLSGYQRDKVTAEILAAMYDASLDQFMPHYWGLNDLFSTYYQTNFWQGIDNFFTLSSIEKFPEEAIEQSFQKRYDRFIFFNSNYHIRHFLSSEISIPGYKMDLHGAVPIGKTYNLATHASIVSVQRRKEISPEEEKLEKPTVPGVEANFQSQIQIRKNFNETAFFLPDLRTDDSGNVEFSFTMPEALTQWKWMSLAHTKDLAFGYSEKTIITQKELMVQPNPPRFIRQGDHLELPVKIVNLSDTEMTGQVQLQLIDPTSNQPVDGWFSNRQPNQYFTAASKQSTSISFPIDVPHVYDKPLTYRIVARTGAEGHELSDGEESILPVLSNRILVTESLPLAMKGPGSKKFSFYKLLKSGNSESLSQHALTVEFSGNPAWYAAESLPYLVEFPYECAEQTFERFYANALASLIANSSSRLKSVFEKWKNDSSVLLSNLEKNQELKSVLLQETPWVMEAKSESEQKKNIALLFDLGGMSCKLVSAFNKLRDMQSGSGGFPWFPGGPTDRYITQYILSGIGHLRKLGSISPEMNARINLILMPALAYADKKISDDYQALKKRNAAIEKSNFLENFQIQYLYLRSFFPEYPIPSESKEAVEFFRKQSRQYWLQQNKYLQGMIALALYRSGDGKTASGILSSLKQNAIHNEELGMYWKEMNGAYYWWQCPVESQALLIEAFSEIGKDNESVNDLKLWLLRQKQVQHWPTTKSTADACYALLLQGSDWLSANPSLHIRLGNQEIVSSGESGGSDGIGYLKKSIDPAFIKPEMGNISVSLTNLKQTNPQPAWGSAYWQYFEDMDQVTQSMQGSNPLKISKKLFVRKNTDKGPVLSPVPENGYLKVGDKITVRIELRSDRDLEYVHLKDMRASCMEPVNVLSGYKWQDGLGYYESTRDASSNFFFSWLTKGTHVFEYDLYVSQSGSFSNGIAKIQCMYAPEFTSHSEGLHINVENKE